MYSFDSSVRFSECDSTGKLTLTAMVNYLQDCAVFHSHERKAGIEELHEKHMAWMIAAWQIKIYEMPRLYNDITISTWVHDLGRIMAPRNFTITSKDGNKTYVEADSLWFMFDFDEMRPTKLTREINAPYDSDHDSVLSLPKTKRNLVCEGCYIQKDPIVVSTHHLDSNMHVNNAQYIDMALAMCEDDFKASYILVQYKKSAKLKDIIIPRIYTQEEGLCVQLCDEDDSIYATVKIYE